MYTLFIIVCMETETAFHLLLCVSYANAVCGDVYCNYRSSDVYCQFSNDPSEDDIQCLVAVSM